MRYWNVHDGDLVRLLDTALAKEGATFEVGHEGGVAVYLGGHFIGIWAELQRDRFSFFPAGYLQPTRSCLPADRLVDVTRELIERERRERRQRLIA